MVVADKPIDGTDARVFLKSLDGQTQSLPDCTVILRVWRNEEDFEYWRVGESDIWSLDQTMYISFLTRTSMTLQNAYRETSPTTSLATIRTLAQSPPTTRCFDSSVFATSRARKSLLIFPINLDDNESGGS